MKRVGSAAALALALLLAGCGGDADLPVLPSDRLEAYHLGAGDQLRIIVYGAQQLTTTYDVDASGNVAIPLIGDVHAGGLTRTQFAHAIATALVGQQLIRTPSVSIDVVKYRPIYVVGEVEHPGQFPFQPGLTMLSAVALAGGFTYRGVQSDATVVRVTEDQTVRGRVTPETLLLPGDVLTIRERMF